MDLHKVQIERKLHLAWQKCAETINTLVASDVWGLRVNSRQPCAKAHTEVNAHTEGLDVIFILFQLLGAESLPAGSVWSHWDALHLSEEGRSHWDHTTVLSAWRHLLALFSPSFSPAMTVSIPPSLLLLFLYPLLFPPFPHFFHVLLSCVCIVHNYLLHRSAAKAPFDLLLLFNQRASKFCFCWHMTLLFICCCTSHAEYVLSLLVIK